MICNSCGFKNKPGNEFCIVCGDTLQREGKSFVEEQSFRKLRTCVYCGNEVSEEDNLCTVCGKSNSSFENFENYKSKNDYGIVNLKILGISIGVILVAIVIVATINLIKNPRTGTGVIPETVSADLVLEKNVSRIASKFICNCGACNKEPLSNCKCQYAIDARKYVREHLEQLQKEDEIIKTVNQIFGGLKTNI
ncbi:MAG: zinc ribbon domain-containing protein [Bacteroidota bacterium]